jgi:hypothetical protein
MQNDPDLLYHVLRRYRERRQTGRLIRGGIAQSPYSATSPHRVHRLLR